MIHGVRRDRRPPVFLEATINRRLDRPVNLSLKRLAEQGLSPVKGKKPALRVVQQFLEVKVGRDVATLGARAHQERRNIPRIGRRHAGSIGTHTTKVKRNRLVAGYWRLDRESAPLEFTRLSTSSTIFHSRSEIPAATDREQADPYGPGQHPRSGTVLPRGGVDHHGPPCGLRKLEIRPESSRINALAAAFRAFEFPGVATNTRLPNS